MSKARRSQEEVLMGILLGTAVGDSLGLPAEGLSRARIRALGWHPWRHRLV
ncbi:MAG: ADP-ribosyl-[dinitrogen reductase] hydrolase, partial [Candidatus Omnitrophota bacterium]